MQAIVFTDLDGTLLDHANYDWTPARPALLALRERGIPVVMVTSKTRPEVERLQDEMGLYDPFVVENGGAIFFPKQWLARAGDDAVSGDDHRALILGRGYRDLRLFVDDLPESFGVEGFGDWSVPEIARRTGLDHDRAALASRREFTEPFVMENEDALPELETLARRAGLRITRGGRFLHLMGESQDKGRAVSVAAERLGEGVHPAPTLIGLGDSPNDLPMLDRVDLAIVVPHVEGTRIELIDARSQVAPAPGPSGWNDAILQILDGLAPYSGTSIGERLVH